MTAWEFVSWFGASALLGFFPVLLWAVLWMAGRPAPWLLLAAAPGWCGVAAVLVIDDWPVWLAGGLLTPAAVTVGAWWRERAEVLVAS